ncbi:MAG: flavin reductase [Clostridiaceae bacterium]|nr:flavin reductase [Eubacteriales bacterium]
MKHEIGAEKPAYLKEEWPGQYEFFSHFEFTAGVPQALCLITTLKENGKSNACFHAWQCFAGDGEAYHAVVAGLSLRGHTYQNILREKEFCINFLSAAQYDACIKTIEENGAENDELLSAGLTPEEGKTVKAPRVKEAFLTLECAFESAQDLSGKGIIGLVVGRVTHAAAENGFCAPDKLCSPEGFMFNVHAPKNPVTGEGSFTAVASLSAQRYV